MSAGSKVRLFRGTMRPAQFLGMPFTFGICWMIVSFLSGIYIVVLTRDDGVTLASSLFVYAFVTLGTLILVREVTKKDPYRLRKIFLWLRLRLAQDNFSHRGELVFVPVPLGRQPRPKPMKSPKPSKASRTKA